MFSSLHNLQCSLTEIIIKFSYLYVMHRSPSARTIYVHVHMCTLTCSTTAIIDAHVHTGIYHTHSCTHGLLVDQQSLSYQHINFMCVCVYYKTVYVQGYMHVRVYTYVTVCIGHDLLLEILCMYIHVPCNYH